MPCLVDTDVFIEGERGNPRFASWLEKADRVATADVVRAEFLLGAHAVSSEKHRQRALRFYADSISGVPSFAHEPSDFTEAARLAGEARRRGQGSPGLADGLLAATALRLGASVATRNLKDFEGMGVDCVDPFES
jgi:toxin FitB